MTVATVFALAFASPISSPAAAASSPAVPTGIKASVTTSSATLTWNRAAGATSYRVCMRTSKTASSCIRSTPRSSSRSVTFTGLKPTGGTDYYAKVSAYNAAGYSRSPYYGFNLAARPIAPAPATGIKNVPTIGGVTVTWNAAKNARTYKVCLLTSATATACSRTSPGSTARKAVFTGLVPSRGADYFSRVSSYNGTSGTRSALARFDLPVGPIRNFTSPAHDKNTFALGWSAATNSDTYELQLATNSGFTGTVRKRTTSGLSYTFTSLVPGTRYYPRMRALNSGLPGGWITSSAQRLPTDPFTAIVTTWNLCGQDKCVTSANGMKKWSTRKPIAGVIARRTGSDIFATQESTSKDTNFVTELPGFTLCRYYSAKSLFIKTVKYSSLRSGAITLDSTRGKYAVWCELQDKVTRTRFIVTDAHLQPHKGVTNDNLRSAQTKVLVTQIARHNPERLPVVYAGDFNSNKANANQSRYPGGYDAPLNVFTSAGIPDSFVTADTRENPTWNSSNQAKNPPIRHSDHIDHIYTNLRILTKAWSVVISVTGALYSTPFASDHNPVRAELIIPGND